MKNVPRDEAFPRRTGSPRVLCDGRGAGRSGARCGPRAAPRDDFCCFVYRMTGYSTRAALSDRGGPILGIWSSFRGPFQRGISVMKFTTKILSALVAGGLIVGAMASAPAVAEEKDIFKLIEADLKALDKELMKIFTPPKK